MAIIELNSEKIKLADWDLKLDNPLIYKKLRQSIIKNNQMDLIHVRELEDGFFEVFKGKKIFKILSEMDKKNFFCFNHGKISKIESKLRYLEMNIRCNNDFINIGESFFEILKEFKVEQIERFVQYDLKEIQDLVNLYNYDWGKLTKKIEKNQYNLEL